MAQKSRLNIIAGVLQPILVIVINYFVKLTIRYDMGQEYLGIQTVYTNFCDILLFAFSGIGIAMLFRLYKPMEENDQPMLRSLFTYYDRIFRGFFIGCLSAGIVMSILVINVINVSVPDIEILAGYILYLLSVLIFNRYHVYHYFIWADHRRYVGCLIWCLTDFVAMFAEIALLVFARSFLLFLTCIVIKNCIESIILVLYSRKHYPFIKEKGNPLTKEGKKAALSDVKDMIISRIGNLLLSSTDSIIISAVVSTVYAGYYSAYYFICQGIEVLLEGLFDSIMSKIGHLMLKSEKDDIFQRYLRTCVVNICITAIIVGTFYNINEDFIILWMGPEIILPSSAVIAITANLFMGSMRHTAMLYRQSAGLFARVSNMILLRGILNIILSIILGKIWGIFGVLISTTITDAVTVYWFEPFTVLKFYKKSYVYELIYQFAGLCAAVSTLFIMKAAISFITVVSWPAMLLKCIIAVVVGCIWMGIWLMTTIAFKKFTLIKH